MKDRRFFFILSKTMILFPHDDVCPTDDLWLFWTFSRTALGIEIGVFETYTYEGANQEKRLSPFYARIRNYFGGSHYPHIHPALVKMKTSVKGHSPWSNDSPFLTAPDGDIWIKNTFDFERNHLTLFRIGKDFLNRHPKIDAAASLVLQAMQKDAGKALWLWNRFPLEDSPLRQQAELEIRTFQALSPR